MNTIEPSNTLHRNNSWIIVSKVSGKPILETYSEAIKDKVNLKAYTVYTALEWLQLFNKQVKEVTLTHAVI